MSDVGVLIVGAGAAGSACAEALRGGGYDGSVLLGDRDLSRRGVEVEFFHGRTRMPAGPAILAIRTGAPLFVVDLWFDETRTMSRLRKIVPPVDGRLDERVKATTQMLADAYAAGIADHPQDWHMLQKLWL